MFYIVYYIYVCRQTAFKIVYIYTFGVHINDEYHYLAFFILPDTIYIFGKRLGEELPFYELQRLSVR